MSKKCRSDDHLDVCSAGELPRETFRWLVPDLFALGQLTIIDGDPGLGKSLLMLDLAARLSRGHGWPEGGGEPASTVYLSAEDGDETLIGRLRVLDADLGRIFLYRSKDPLLERALSFPANIGFLDRALARTGARLVVIDPVIAFLDPDIISASDEGVRRALYPLAQLARKHDCVMVLIRHLNKRAGSRSLYRGGGSIGFVAHCRSAWLVGREPAHCALPRVPASPPAGSTTDQPAPAVAAQAAPPARCVLAQQKNNNGPLQPSLLYQIVGDDSGCPKIVWLGPSPLTAEELVALPPRIAVRPRGRAIRFLKRFLAAGPVATDDIWKAALEHDLFERTLRRAKTDLGIEDKVAWINGSRRCYWMFPHHELPGTVRSTDAAVLAFERTLDDLRKKYPPFSPLDDPDAPVPPEPVAKTAAPSDEGTGPETAPVIPAIASIPATEAEAPVPEAPTPAETSVASATPTTETGEPAAASTPPLATEAASAASTAPAKAEGEVPTPDVAQPSAAQARPRLPKHAAWLESVMAPRTVAE